MSHRDELSLASGERRRHAAYLLQLLSAEERPHRHGYQRLENGWKVLIGRIRSFKHLNEHPGHFQEIVDVQELVRDVARDGLDALWRELEAIHRSIVDAAVDPEAHLLTVEEVHAHITTYRERFDRVLAQYDAELEKLAQSLSTRNMMAKTALLAASRPHTGPVERNPRNRWILKSSSDGGPSCEEVATAVIRMLSTPSETYVSAPVSRGLHIQLTRRGRSTTTIGRIEEIPRLGGSHAIQVQWADPKTRGAVERLIASHRWSA